jgi:hypothetical protein
MEPDALFGVRSAPIVPKFVPNFSGGTSLPIRTNCCAPHRSKVRMPLGIQGSNPRLSAKTF